MFISIGGAASISSVAASMLLSPRQTEEIAVLTAIAMLGASAGAVFPDYDEFGKISIPSIVPWLLKAILALPFFIFSPSIGQKILSAKTGHRTYTHSVLWILLNAIPFLFFWKSGLFIIFGLLGFWIGQIYHILADMFTKTGCPLLWPFSEKSCHLAPSFLLVSTGKSFLLEGFYVFLFSAIHALPLSVIFGKFLK